MAGVLSVGSSVARMGFFGQQLDNVWVLTSTEDLSTWRWGDATQLGALQVRLTALPPRCTLSLSAAVLGATPAHFRAEGLFVAAAVSSAEHEEPLRGGCGERRRCRSGALGAGRLPHRLPLGRGEGLALAHGGAPTAAAAAAAKTHQCPL